MSGRSEPKRGVILAGGYGTRLRPATKALSKHLLPIFDKPMVYYPLTTLILSGVEEVLVICDPRQLPIFEELLGDGSRLGISIHYSIQEKPRGLAEAPLIAEGFLGESAWMLILGDNLFHGAGVSGVFRDALNRGRPTIWGVHVANAGRYGVITLDESGAINEIEEKPVAPKSNIAIPGIYIFDSSAVQKSKTLQPSRRNELEIVDLLQMYIDEKNLGFEILPRGAVWLDTGTFDSLTEANDYVRTIQNRQNLLIGSPEEAAWRMGLISSDHLARLAEELSNSTYGSYLKMLIQGR